MYKQLLVDGLLSHLMIKVTVAVNPTMLTANRTPRAMTTAWLEAESWGRPVSMSKWRLSPNTWTSACFTSSDWLFTLLMDQTQQIRRVTAPTWLVIPVTWLSPKYLMTGEICEKYVCSLLKIKLTFEPLQRKWPLLRPLHRWSWPKSSQLPSAFWTQRFLR